jgi:monothiol glutaredoxin
MRPELKDRFDREIRNNRIVLYMKGTADFPRCGFSAAAVEALRQFGQVYTVDVLADPEVRDAIKEYSNWPTIPQCYINGKFIGGSDIVRELAERGELGDIIEGRAS